MKHQLVSVYCLENFTSEYSKIIINKNLKIIKLNSTDKNDFFKRIEGITQHKENINVLSKNEYFLHYIYETDLIKDSLIPDDISFNMVDKLLQLFRTFQEGKIKIKYYRRFIQSKTTNKLESIGSVSLNKEDTSNYDTKYHISRFSKTKFIKYARDFDNTNFEKNKSLAIALKRFSFSYEKRDLEDKIIDIMICYEALFLGGNEKSELNYKLALRVSRFVKNHNRKELFTFIKKAYDVRSKLVHGSSIKKEIDTTIPFEEYNYVHSLRKILRFCFKEIITKYKNQSIESIINIIDEKIIEGK